jgi:hypothetical protein
MRRNASSLGAVRVRRGVAGWSLRGFTSCRPFLMSNLLPSFGRLAVVACLLVLPQLVRAQNAFSPGGNDYPIAGVLPGDQNFPQAAVSTNGGVLVWQDNATDGDGLGLRMERLDANFNQSGAPFRVNAQGVGEQEKPQVALLNNGGAVIVWQGGRLGFQKIYARFLSATGTNFSTGDILVNTYTNNFQVYPAVATLTDGNVVVVWASYGQDGALQGIYGQRLTPTGAKLGGEFQINQYTLNNQRTPSVAALAGGGFVVAWVSELQRGFSTVDIYARLFNNAGAAVGNEFPVNTVLTNICANPSVAASPDGGFAIAWSQRDVASGNSFSAQFTTSTVSSRSLNSWDVYVRTYNANGSVASSPVRMNSYTYGDQYAPRLSAFGKNYLAVWLSLGQDGSMEGVYGQFLSRSAALAGVEFRVNTDNGSRQINPIVTSDGTRRFLVVWSSYATSGNFDLFAREYHLIELSITPLAQGVRISWNTRPGCTYQVQTSTNYTQWSNYGAPRPASGFSDFIDVTNPANTAVYRVIRIQ